MQKAESVVELASMVANDDNLANEIKQDPAKALARIAQSPLRTDKVIYRLVVSFLGLLTLIAICGGLFLATKKIDQPEILLALGSAAVGALAGLLAPAPGR